MCLQAFPGALLHRYQELTRPASSQLPIAPVLFRTRTHPSAAVARRKRAPHYTALEKGRPFMFPVLLEPGLVKLTYGLMIAIGFLIALNFMQRDAKKACVDPTAPSPRSPLFLFIRNLRHPRSSHHYLSRELSRGPIPSVGSRFGRAASSSRALSPPCRFTSGTPCASATSRSASRSLRSCCKSRPRPSLNWPPL